LPTPHGDAVSLKKKSGDVKLYEVTRGVGEGGVNRRYQILVLFLKVRLYI
jgi:hypothetical protein